MFESGSCLSNMNSSNFLFQSLFSGKLVFAALPKIKMWKEKKIYILAEELILLIFMRNYGRFCQPWHEIWSDRCLRHTKLGSVYNPFLCWSWINPMLFPAKRWSLSKFLLHCNLLVLLLLFEIFNIWLQIIMLSSLNNLYSLYYF